MEARVFFCHGSRDPTWRAPFDRLVADYQSRFPAHHVTLAFLELMQPLLPEVLEDLVGSGFDQIRIHPLFLAPGAHTRVDLPAMVDDARRRWPDLQVRVEPTLLEAPGVRTAVIEALDPFESI